MKKVLLVVGILAAQFSIIYAFPPPPGFSFQADVIRVVDGDTVVVRPIPPDVTVRLLDCWAPEIHTKDSNKRELGIVSKNNLEKILLEKTVIVYVPSPKSWKLEDAFSFGRVLAKIYVDDKDVSDLQVKGGFAFPKKPGF